VSRTPNRTRQLTRPRFQGYQRNPYRAINITTEQGQEKSGRHFGWVAWHLVTVVLFATAWIFFDYFNPESEATLFVVSAAVAVESALLLVWCRRCVGGLFSPHGLFMIAAICFNAGQAIVCVLGGNPGDGIYALPHAITLQTLLFVGFGLAVFNAGSMTMLFDETATPMHGKGATPRSQAVWNLGLTMMLLGLPFWVYETAITMQRVAQFGRSTGVFGFGTVTGVERIPQLIGDFFPAGVLWILAGSHSRGSRQLAIAGITMVVMANLATGSRGPALMAAVAFVWLWHAVVKRIRSTHILLGAAAVFVIVIPGIETTREGWGPNGFSPSYLLSQYQAINNPALKAMSEMGWSATTVSHTILLVPSVRPWDLGMSYVWALSTVLPNVTGGTHIAKAHGYLADWLIRTLYPDYAARGGGWGFSFLAESYANGGWSGSLVLLLVQGVLLGALWRWVYRMEDPARYAFGATVLMSVLFYTRAESACLARALVWQGIVPYAVLGVCFGRHRVMPACDNGIRRTLYSHGRALLNDGLRGDAGVGRSYS
jgi:oligosaccharide repeat unit polymerase